MKLSLKNVGKIKKATVEIKGITVIAGENNTGKSTVGRALYSVFNSFYNIDEQIYKEKLRSIDNLFNFMHRYVNKVYVQGMEIEEIAFNILKDVEKYSTVEQLKEEIIKYLLQYDEDFEDNENIDELSERIYEIIKISDEDIFKTVLGKSLDTEFYGQVNNIFTEEEAEICLHIKDIKTEIKITDNKVKSVDNRFGLRTEVIYFDDPFILDEQRNLFGYRYNMNYMSHRTHLKYKLFNNLKHTNVIDEIVVNNKFEKIYDKINEICDGNIVRARRNVWGYRKANTDKVLDARNLSTGLKTFVILKTLLSNGSIEYNGTIILDEPEIHLHPEWQLLFAELIVLIQKEFGVHILLNTHSPYFLNAIEVYAAKYGLADKCKYYLAVVEEGSSYLDDVTNDIEKIYSKLAKPLQDLENERYRDD